MKHIYNLNQEDFEFKTGLDYVERPCHKTNKEGCLDIPENWNGAHFASLPF